jgi:hypothetical protein
MSDLGGGEDSQSPLSENEEYAPHRDSRVDLPKAKK